MKINLFIILIASVLLLILAILVVANNNSRVNKPSNTVQQINDFIEFRSKNLDISLQIPKNYSVNEKLTFVELSKAEAKIQIVRNATDFASLNEYLTNADTQKNLVISQESSLLISENEARSRIELNKNNKKSQKVYYIYTDNWVYVISTHAEAHYSDLDQIAQSFRYTP